MEGGAGGIKRHREGPWHGTRVGLRTCVVPRSLVHAGVGGVLLHVEGRGVWEGPVLHGGGGARGARGGLSLRGLIARTMGVERVQRQRDGHGRHVPHVLHTVNHETGREEATR